MTVMVAPVGTPIHDKSKWHEIGTRDRLTWDMEVQPEIRSWQSNSTLRQPPTRSVMIDYADGRRIHIPNAAIRVTQPSEEDKLSRAASYFTGQFGASVALTHPEPDHSVLKVTGSGSYSYHSTAASALKGAKDHSFLALRVLENIGAGPATVKETTLDGRTSYETDKAKVYRAENEGEALRNLHFAIVNLKSYLYWITKGKAAKEQRDRELKAAEERAAKQRKEDAEKRRINTLALKLYNANRGVVSSTPWPWTMGDVQKSKWLDLAKQADEISKPQISNSVISANTINTTKISDDIFRALNQPIFGQRNRPFGY